jgi:hypothetical protein
MLWLMPLIGFTGEISINDPILAIIVTFIGLYALLKFRNYLSRFFAKTWSLAYRAAGAII